MHAIPHLSRFFPACALGAEPDERCDTDIDCVGVGVDCAEGVVGVGCAVYVGVFACTR
jgi:hypothetical protein